MSSRPLTNEEAALVIHQTDNLMHKALICLGVKTGYRISELLCITVKDVFDGMKILDTVTVKRCNMKGKHVSRTVVLHRDAQVILKDYLTQMSGSCDEKLFPISRFAAHRIIKQAVKRAKLSGRISTHSMRKTFGMKVYERTGKDVVAAQRALGHASLASTTKYLSVGQEVIDEAILSD